MGNSFPIPVGANYSPNSQIRQGREWVVAGSAVLSTTCFRAAKGDCWGKLRASGKLFTRCRERKPPRAGGAQRLEIRLNPFDSGDRRAHDKPSRKMENRNG